MKKSIGIAILGMLIGCAACAIEDKVNVVNKADDAITVTQQTINLPGVEKLVKEFDTKILENSKDFQEKKIMPFSKDIEELNKEILVKCAGQEKLDKDCKDVLIKQALKQIQLFKNSAEYNNNTAKIMEEKLKYLKKMP